MPENQFFASISTIYSDYNKNQDISDASCYIASLTKISRKFNITWATSGQKNNQERPNMIVSAGVQKHLKV